MKKVLGFSLLLVAGMVGSQVLSSAPADAAVALRETCRLLTMLCLSFIMIHVGYEFDIDRSNLKRYAVDYGVAATAAGFPWIFCSLWFLFVMMPSGAWATWTGWTESLLAGRFAAPTSAGILFSMLAAAGLSATWLFRKARILAIFDDLDTVLLMIPLKAMIVGPRWQLLVIIAIMATFLYLAWKWLHKVRIPITWPWVVAYSAGIAAVCEMIYQGSKLVDDVVPVHIEVLLPAFVLGCMIARPPGHDPHRDDAREGHQEGPESSVEQRVSTIVSGLFMVLVGLSMPPISVGLSNGGSNLGSLLFHTLILTVLANFGKMFPLFCYRREAGWRERLALCVGMWPRGEVGAGVLVISVSYGIGGDIVAVATLSLALNLILTGVFIWAVKKLLREPTGSNPGRNPGEPAPEGRA